MMPLGFAEAWLVDDRWAKAYPLGDSTTIGRAPENTIILRDPSVSRQHATVSRRESGFVLLVHGASATRLNGETVPPDNVLGEGDTIEIAHTVLRFTLKAPTGEMFVVRRDRPTPYDNAEIPTDAPLRAANPLVAGWQKHWHFIVGIILLALMLLVLLGAPVPGGRG
jgi:pSer/pThr/pTyr-binding forkhead associated (FHA) protein